MSPKLKADAEGAGEKELIMPSRRKGRLELRGEVAARLVWSRANSRITPFCSLCQRHIADDDVPLMIWNRAGDMAQLCDDCALTAIRKLA